MLTKLLPDKVAKEPDGAFLQRSVQLPPRSPQSRARERVRGWLRGPRVAQKYIAAAAADALLSGPVRLAVDACPAKGQRSTSTY